MSLEYFLLSTFCIALGATLLQFALFLDSARLREMKDAADAKNTKRTDFTDTFYVR